MLKQFIFSLTLITLVSPFGCQSSSDFPQETFAQTEQATHQSASAQTQGTGNTASRDFQTLTNGEWTIRIDRLDSWSGVNGTGDLGYRGCDSRDRCLSLTGGQMSCREGICTMAWRNGNYTYIIEQPMDNPDNPTEPGMGTVLIVRQGEKILLRATGFKAI